MNNSPYLDRTLLPLTVVLPRMLERIKADLATAGPAETRLSLPAGRADPGATRAAITFAATY
jgi:hypothetical protein